MAKLSILINRRLNRARRGVAIPDLNPHPGTWPIRW